ncbi:MAG: hypothetical protein EBS49_02155 [Verrucomicrobia bacterium]|nr:hypothetical protein [Verrucomicrobiota bacterium]
MIHPLVDTTDLTDKQLEEKIQELSKKYFMVGGAELKNQVALILNIYKNELQNRRMKSYEEQFEKNKEKGLDNLINFN